LFCVPYEHIRQTSLAVSVMDYDRMGRNERIGQVVLGAKSGPMDGGPALQTTSPDLHPGLSPNQRLCGLRRSN